MKLGHFLPIVLFVSFTATAYPVQRVVLIDFSSNDSSYRSAQAAVEFSALLQAKLTGMKNIEWVERSQLETAEDELNLAAGGYISPSTALHLGKFVKADLLVTGRFISNQHRELDMEVIDLDHADVLAELSMPIHGATNAPLKVVMADVETAARNLENAFQSVRQKSAQIKKQIIIAPLFFANTSRSRRLDFFENELQTAISNTMSSHNLHVLRFPRAKAAAGESELVLAGLVEQDPAAWQKVADIYVWGRYEEVKPGQFTFQDTPVRFTLSIWDGSAEIKTITQTAKVSELPQLKERLVEQILRAARRYKKHPIGEEVRHQVSRQLLLRACNIQTLFKPEAYTFPPSSLLDTKQGQQLWRYQVKLLTTAYFFSPESYLVHRIWLDTRWERPSASFSQWLERIRDYDDFDDDFGLISPPRMEFGPLPQAQWAHFERPRTVDSKLESEWIHLYRDICNAIDRHDKVGFPIKRPPDFPSDAPADVLESWKAQIGNDMMRRMFTMYEKAIHANPAIPVRNAHLFIDDGLVGRLQDKQLRAKFFEDLWPAYLASRDMPTARHEFSAKEYDIYFAHGLFPEIRQIFAAVGRPHEAEAYIAQFNQKVRIVGNPAAAYEAAEAHRQRLVRVDLLPPKLTPKLRYVMFPDTTTVNGIVALKFNADVLWISTRGGAMTLNDPAWEYLVSPQTNAVLWRLSAHSSTPEMLSLKKGGHSKVTSFCVESNQLWMTLEQNGVFCLNMDTLRVTRYGGRQGVLSRQMFASALVGNRLYFGGGEPNNGELNQVELPGLIWKSQKLGDNGQIKLLQSFGHSLVVNNRILDVRSGKWLPIRQVVPGADAKPTFMQQPPPKFDVLAATADSNALWLGTTLGLVSYNPDTGAHHVWLDLPGGYLVNSSGVATTVVLRYRRSKNGTYVADTNMTATATAAPTSRIPGAVTALASDGDFLWVAATTRFDPSLDGNETEGRWIDDHYVLTLTPGINTGKAGKNGEWRNMYVQNERDYVMLFYKPTGKWVGYFPVTSRVTSLAVSREKLWIGLEDKGYVQYGDHPWQDWEVFTPSPLIEVQKSRLLSIPPDQWVSDKLSANEMRSRIQEAVRVLKARDETAALDPQVAIDRRNEFLQRNFAKFVPVQFRKGANGEAAIQYLHVRENRFEYNGRFFAGFRFTVPQWIDGDFEWMQILAKTEAGKDFDSTTFEWYIVPESGQSKGFEYFSHERVANYPYLHERFPFTHGFYVQSLDQKRLEPGRTYAIWFGFKEQNMPDIAFAMTIGSERGIKEYGKLPLR